MAVRNAGQVPETGHLRRVNCVFRTRIPTAPPPKKPVRRTFPLAGAPSTPQIAFDE